MVVKFNKLIKKYCVLGFALAGALSTNTASARHDPIALIGGQGDAPYAAFIQDDGTIAKLQGLPLSGLTYRVAINSSGQGIIGGTSSAKAYAALVSPEGVLNPLYGLMAPGEIYTVGINRSGDGIIGGGHFDTNVPYAALVAGNGNLTPLNMPLSGLIYSVAIDNSGEGIVGGIGPSNSAYASIVSSTGSLAPLTGLPSTGAIYWVASNDSKTRFIGGQDNSNIYAAFVNPEGTVLPVSGLPAGVNYSVALNESGQAIMGGTASNLPYVAFVAPNGSVKTLGGLPNAEGKIYTVGINASGTGIVAGFSGSRPLGGLTLPNGAFVPFIGLPTGEGFVDGAAIHDAGVAIIGGTSDDKPFVAVVAPNGNLTYLNGLPGNGEINSISISTLDSLVPKSIGPFDSWANTQYALSDALTQHSLFHRNSSRCLCPCNSALPSFHFDNTNSSLWLSVLGSYVREKSHRTIPNFSNNITGVLLGYDYLGIKDVVIGGGFAYAHNSIHYGNRGGKAASDQEYGFIYLSHSGPVFYVNFALWGGVFHTKNKRQSLGLITSTANPSGWNLSPHVEISAPMPMSLSCLQFIVDPFVTLDWSHNWQNHYCEKGDSGFNISLSDQHASILRSEIGLRFYETFQFCWGNLFLEEMLSYVNRAPIHGKKVNAAFIGSWSSFQVDTLNSSAINQGIYQLHAECSPTSLKGVYASLDFQGSFGSQINSQTLTFSIGKSF